MVLKNAPDLTKRPPRSPRVRLGGYVILPRVLDKGRAAIAGTIGEYSYGCPTDDRFLSFVGIDAEALKKQLAPGKGDGEILAWIEKHAKHKRTDSEIMAWSALQERRAPDNVEGREFCARLLAAQGNPTAAAKNAAARTYFTDVILVNQDGKEMRFYSDLIEGKVIILIPFFTTCTGICPPMNRNLEKIQDWLGDRLGKDVNMLSISVDPLTDTVPRLKEYSQRFHAEPGWHFLSGAKENGEAALKKIGQYVEAKEDHCSIMIIGNLRTGLWKKARALGKIEECE